MSDGREHQQGWDSGWDGHRDAQARRLATLSLREKLDWLEEAHARVLRMQAAAPQVRETPPEGPPTRA